MRKNPNYLSWCFTYGQTHMMMMLTLGLLNTLLQTATLMPITLGGNVKA